MKKKKNKSKNIITYLLLLILLIVIIFIIIVRRPNYKRKLIGTWTTDGVTIYEFDKNNKGKLIVPLSTYDFTYKVDKDKLYIDFKNEKSTDSEYTYSFDGNKLILDGDNGKFTFIKK